MLKIEPKYVSFEQAKWLKEIDFNEECKTVFYVPDNSATCVVDFVEDETIGGYYIKRPEQWQVVEWLRVNHNIDLQDICNYGRLCKTYRMGIIFINNKNEVDMVFLRPIDTIFDFIEFNSPQETYSAAFDYIRENKLIKQ
jgi:hypothetical protein